MAIKRMTLAAPGRKLNVRQYVGHYRQSWLDTANELQAIGAVQYRRASSKKPFEFEMTHAQVPDLMKWIGAKGYKTGSGMWYDPTGKYATLRIIGAMTADEGIVIVELYEPPRR